MPDRSKQSAAERARQEQEQATRPRIVDYLRNIGAALHPSNLREWFTRESVINGLKTFAWVAPLTILIWIYAEREQVTTMSDQAVPIDVRISGSNKIATLVNPPDRNITLDLRGPRQQLAAIKNELSRPASDPRLILDLDPNLPPGVRPIMLATLIQRHPFFADRGVEVVSASPSEGRIIVDEIVEAEVPVVIPPDVDNLEQAVFDPPAVRYVGPKTVMEAAQAEGTFQVYPELRGRDELKRPGTHELSGLPLKRQFQGNHVTLSPTAVDATVRVREQDAVYTMNQMTIFLSHPPGMLDRYRVEYDPILERVTLIGPPQLIQAIRDQTISPRPKARLEVTDDLPIGIELERPLRFDDLPEGVVVSKEDQHRTVRFTIVHRGSD